MLFSSGLNRDNRSLVYSLEAIRLSSSSLSFTTSHAPPARCQLTVDGKEDMGSVGYSPSARSVSVTSTPGSPGGTRVNRTKGECCTIFQPRFSDLKAYARSITIVIVYYRLSEWQGTLARACHTDGWTSDIQCTVHVILSGMCGGFSAVVPAHPSSATSRTG